MGLEWIELGEDWYNAICGNMVAIVKKLSDKHWLWRVKVKDSKDFDLAESEVEAKTCAGRALRHAAKVYRDQLESAVDVLEKIASTECDMGVAGKQCENLKCRSCLAKQALAGLKKGGVG